MSRFELDVPLDGHHHDRRPVWAGVAVRYEDGTIAAWQIDNPTDGTLTVERERLDDGTLSRPALSDPTLEITVRGPAGAWDRGARGAAAELAQRRQVEAGQPDWRCQRCGSDRWVGYRAGPEHDGWPRRAQCVPCGHVQDAPGSS